jgi:hypothetical protein
LYFIILEASPLPTHARHGELGGAFAACWVATDDPIVAESQARSLLSASMWETHDVDEHYPVERERYLGDEELLALFDQAAADGIAVNLNTWPAGAPEE